MQQVETFGGDVVKFAGDALIVEWRATPSIPIEYDDSANHCGPDYSASSRNFKGIMTMTCAMCAASIVESCSDYPVHYGEGNSSTATLTSYLNVYCGVGYGSVLGVHVGGDSNERMEYLLLGNPIQQVAQCMELASSGQVVASPQALSAMSAMVTWDRSIETQEAALDRPRIVANKSNRFFQPKKKLGRTIRRRHRLEQQVSKLDLPALKQLKGLVSLYVHPSVVEDEVSTKAYFNINQNPNAPMGRLPSYPHDQQNLILSRRVGTTRKLRHRSKSELRSVFTVFMQPLLPFSLTEARVDNVIDSLTLLNQIFLLVHGELSRFGGQLRQYILDDKGLVLIANFGLRGSTFPDMVERRAVPFCIFTQQLLKTQLRLESRIGATYGTAYCGVVGGVNRHEYAVLGPSVNLAARLMAHPLNPKGFLVDEAIRQKAFNVRQFDALPPLDAKGYDNPVPIFVPTKSRRIWRNPEFSALNFVGRRPEREAIRNLASRFLQGGEKAVWTMITAEFGSGKTSFLAKSMQDVRGLCKNLGCSCLISGQALDEGSFLQWFWYVQKE